MRKPVPSDYLDRSHHLSQTADLETMYSRLDDDQDDLPQLAMLMEQAMNRFGNYVVGIDVGAKMTVSDEKGKRHAGFGRLNFDNYIKGTVAEFSISPSHVGLVVETPCRLFHASNFETCEIVVLLVNPGKDHIPVQISLRSVVCRALLERESISYMVDTIKAAVHNAYSSAKK